MAIRFNGIGDLNKKLRLKIIHGFLFLLMAFLSTSLQAKNYYISSLGNDANTGLSAATAWKTITKINSFTFSANDSILFNRGESFYGGIVVKQGNINFGAYGSGAKPIITGLSTVKNWVNLGGNIWEAPVSNVKSGVNLVLRNNTLQQVGRYPNADAVNGGYLTYTASTKTSLTGTALSSATNWTGAEIVIKGNRWSISRQKITSHLGAVVGFTANPAIPGINYGYFFQRDSRTLDKDGEWWHNVAGNKLRMYFSSNDPGLYTVQIATIDTLFKSQAFNNVTIRDLAFIGADKKSILINGGSFITVTNVDINNSGGEAITAKSVTNATVDRCTATNNLGSGICLVNTKSGKVNFLVQNCTITNTAFIAGMETSNEGNGGEGINCLGGDGIRVLYNKVVNSGYSGIRWQGNDVYIKYNLIDRFCTIRDDGGGIYTWEAVETRTLTRLNRNIVSNIVINGIGNDQGTSVKTTSVQGLYFDNGTKTVKIDSNTVAYVINGAFHSNNCNGLTFTNNVFFGNDRSASFQRFEGAALVRNIIMKKNILYPYKFRYRNLGIDLPATTKEADIPKMGTFDSNYYSIRPLPDKPVVTVTCYTDGSNYKEEYFDFSYLSATVGIEKHSIQVANNGILAYNASSSSKNVAFSGLSYKDVYGVVYNNSATIPAWSSKVLIPNGTAAVSNKPPVANAGNNLSITLPIATVTLSGTGADPDGTITKYSWAKISGPSSGLIVTPLGGVTILLNLAAGTFKYELTVTDNKGATGKDTVQVIVNSLLNLLPAVNPANTVNGLNYKYYEGTWLTLPSFRSLTPVKTGTIANFDLSPASIQLNYGFSFTGYINVPSDGMYTFYTSSDDGSQLLIDNILVVQNDGLHGPVLQSGVIGLKAGKHAITGLYFQKGGGASFNVSYSYGSVTKQAIPASALYRVSSNPAARTAGGNSLNPAGLSNMDLNENTNLKISSSPNPSATEFRLFVEGGSDKNVGISVISTDGRIVFSTTGPTNKIYKFGNNFMPGLYTIKVIQDGSMQILKVIRL